jgi:hypothetical protein
MSFMWFNIIMFGDMSSTHTWFMPLGVYYSL